MLNIVFNEELSKDSEWHFMPVLMTSLEETSIPNAKIGNYFKPSIKEEPVLTATLHGHLLRGTKP
jgi:hypothetical protein